MSKVITFSRVFPAYHPKKGQPTNFVEKIWLSLLEFGEISISKMAELSRETGIGDFDINKIRKLKLSPKYHTIRAGNRWKVGDKFSPRVWSGKPYQSKQIIIAPDIEIVKVWDIEIYGLTWQIGNKVLNSIDIGDISKNDGLSSKDLKDWFNKLPFAGQIICWNDKIEY